MADQHAKLWKYVVVLLAIIAIGIGSLWQYLQKPILPSGIVASNGRIEAIEVDITSKFGGRLATVLVNEGDNVNLKQSLAQMDTKELDAQLRRANAEVRRARQEKNVATAVIAQRKSELSLAKKDLERSKGLYENDSISLEQLQRDETSVQTAQATLAAAKAQRSNADAAIEAAIANTELLKVQLDDSVLKAPINGRVLYRLSEPGEVLPAGGKVLTILDPMDIYMTVFLPTKNAVKLAVGVSSARLILDGIPDTAIPATVTFVAPSAQFTPKEVETRTEREKLMFRVKIKLDADFLKNHIELAKTGVPGMAYIRLDSNIQWPDHLL